jgi:myo-inositol-1(or 4)-monophosphatase
VASEGRTDTSATGTDGFSADAWLDACRRMVVAQRELFDASPSIAERTVYEGVGEGGDRSLAIDRRCEDIVFAELEPLAAAAPGLTAISEERGEVVFGDSGAPLRVVIDPIDGSLNARRTLPSHSLSIAVADGPSLANVVFGYVYDFGAREEFTAIRGEGARLGDRELRAVGPGYGLEVVGMESAKPERVIPAAEALAGKTFRIRAIGSIAISLCYVAGARLDGMLTGRPCRSVDLAAAQLVVREAGGVVVTPGLEPESASLDLDARYHVAAALDEEMLEPLLAAQRRVDEAEEAGA